MLRITDSLAIDENDLHEDFIHSGGPGGQNVNKVATAVQLRFAIQGLPPAVQARLAQLAGRRLTEAGEIVITARSHRTRELNRADALARLIELLQRACETTKPRRPTKPGRGAVEKRLKAKQHRTKIKSGRQACRPDD